MANGMYSKMIIRTTDILGDVEEFEIPQPDCNELEEMDKEYPYNADDPRSFDCPFWFENELGWNWTDFSNPEIYRSVEVLWR